MDPNEHNAPVGNDRLEEMTGDRRKGKKMPGPGFWLLFCILFIGACFLFGWIFGGMIRSGIDSIKSKPEAASPADLNSPEPALEQESAPARIETGPAAAAPTEGNPPTEEPAPAEEPLSQIHPPVKKPVTIGETDIYLDEDGVWRNLNRGDEPGRSTASSRPNQIFPVAGGLGLDGQNLNELSGMINMMSGLLGSGGSSAQGGQNLDDLSGMISMVSGLLGSGGSSAQGGQNLDDLSGIMNLMSGVTGSRGSSAQQSNGDLMQMLNSLQQGPVSGNQRPWGQGGLSGNDPSLDNRRQMKVKVREAARPAGETKAQIQRPQSGNRIESFEGFERFDPKDAANIKSQWEYFDDPR